MRTERHKGRRARDERGAALLEFALIFPIFMTIVLGMFSGGQAYDQKLSLTSAAREGTRYAATLPKNQAFPVGTTWASAVTDVIVARSAGDLNAGDVCVALVTGSGSAPTVVTGTGTFSTSGSACYADGISDAGERVQVVVNRPSTLQLLFISYPLDLKSSATARFEAGT